MIGAFLRKHKIYPRRWLLGLISYSRFIGYIRPALSSGKSVDYSIWRKLLVTAWEPRELSFPIGKRILAISPHADDEAIGAGGILSAHRDVAEIHIVVVTDGAAYGFVSEAGNCPELEKAQLVQVRRQELLKTAGALNAKSVSFLDLPDRGIAVDEISVARLRAVVESARPDVVILPWFLDGHPDHRAANLLFARACKDRSALVLGYEIWSVLDPNAYFEITDHLDAKLGLVKNYVSQLKEVDYLTFAQGLAWVRGYQLVRSRRAKKAAEAFVALPAEDYCSLVNEVL
jgi:LmbE family N-acetylglucosaminyl deacetylase